MKIAFSAKLALVLSRVFNHVNRIDIEEYSRGKYNMDTVMERLDEIKAAAHDLENIAMYLYSDSEVQKRLGSVLDLISGDLIAISKVAQAAGRSGSLKYSEYLLYEYTNLDAMVNYCTVMKKSHRDEYEKSTNPAMKKFLEISEERLVRNMQWLEELKHRKDAGESWGHNV